MTVAPTTAAVWSDLSSDLRRFIRRRVADEHLADDLLQETFVRIHRAIARLGDSDRLAAWVYQIARNVIADHFRKSGSEVSLADMDPAGADAADGVGDCFAPYRARAEEWMGELIEQLPETYREAVRQSEIAGLSQQEVADRLGLSLSGAKSRIQRGRAMLKGALDRCCAFEFDRRGNVIGCDPRSDRTVCRNCEEPEPLHE